jgi:hypothetical protein
MRLQFQHLGVGILLSVGLQVLQFSMHARFEASHQDDMRRLQSQITLTQALIQAQAKSATNLMNESLEDPFAPHTIKGTMHGEIQLKVTKEHLSAVPTVVPPSAFPYNISSSSCACYHSQDGQDKFVDDQLKGMRGGFFIEAGAYDGVRLSNTLFLEKEKGWSGLLIEGNPKLFQKILKTNRKCFAAEGAISSTGRKESVNFLLAGPIGGQRDKYPATWEKRVKDDLKIKQDWTQFEEGTGEEVKVTAYPLMNYLEAVRRLGGLRLDGYGRYVIDFFSLDTEGSELSILKSLDFSKLLVGIFIIEVAGNEADREG